MSNTFNVGDKITVTGTGIGAQHCGRDTTEGKVYTITAAMYRKGVDSPEIQRVRFNDDVDDSVVLYATDVTLAEA